MGSAAARAFMAQPWRLGSAKVSRPDLGQHAGPLGGGLAMHVEEDARGHVIGRDLVALDHLPDFGGSAEDGPEGYEPAMILARQPGLAM